MPLVDEVLGNLVGNACRYAAGEVVLEVRVRAAGDGAALELTVADDGPGFSAEALRHGCDAFFGEAKSAEHFGLGLAIAAALVHLHGGALTLANAPIGGARVTATFDVEVPPERRLERSPLNGLDGARRRSPGDCTGLAKP